MKLPRDLSGDSLISRLAKLGYAQTRQTGSHIRLTRETPDGQHHITIPRHKSLRVGTLNAILVEIASHLQIDRTELLQRIQKR